MFVVFDSLTGNVKRFVNKLALNNVKIIPNLIVNQQFVLITYTIGFGEIPTTTEEFLQQNKSNMIGVAVSGNRVWGDRFARAADTISARYNVPIIHKFELGGTKKDVEIFLQEAQKIVESDSQMDRAQQ